MLLITGGAGFLGRSLQREFQDIPHVAPSHQELDLCDAGAVVDFLRENGVTQIIHAAGRVGGIGYHKERPGDILTENLRMGLNVLAAAAKRGGARVILVSSACVYPADAPIPSPETSIHQGLPAHDTLPYGTAKRTLHVAAEALGRQYDLDWLIAIPTNLYGPGDHYEPSRSHVAAALLRRAHEAKEAGHESLPVWGDGSQTRDLLYGPDFARGLKTALHSRVSREDVNFGSGRETSIKELAETICEVVGFRGLLEWDTTKPMGVIRKQLDATKARELLGWKAETSLKTGLSAAYRDFLSRSADL